MRPWFFGLIVIAALSIPFWATDLDTKTLAAFYDAGTGWVHKNDQPWSVLYHYGVVPAWIVSLTALGALVASIRWKRAVPYRRACWFLVLAMAIGPGLVVNSALKQQWGRPRPRDITEFGGKRDYVRPWVKRPAEYGNAFASGHAATGFYLMAPFFLLRRRRKRIARAFMAAGIVFGSLVGLARMIQGAHFPSDVVWAGILVYLTCAALGRALRIDNAARPVAS